MGLVKYEVVVFLFLVATSELTLAGSKREREREREAKFACYLVCSRLGCRAAFVEFFACGVDWMLGVERSVRCAIM